MLLLKNCNENGDPVNESTGAHLKGAEMFQIPNVILLRHLCFFVLSYSTCAAVFKRRKGAFHVLG